MTTRWGLRLLRTRATSAGGVLLLTHARAGVDTEVESSALSSWSPAAQGGAVAAQRVGMEFRESRDFFSVSCWVHLCGRAAVRVEVPGSWATGYLMPSKLQSPPSARWAFASAAFAWPRSSPPPPHRPITCCGRLSCWQWGRPPNQVKENFLLKNTDPLHRAYVSSTAPVWCCRM